MEFVDEQDIQVLTTGSDFAFDPGAPNDTSTKAFLDRFPLPIIFRALQDNIGAPGPESILTACLERVFRTKFGASLVPQYMPLVHAGLKSDSEAVTCLACKSVSCFVENCDGSNVQKLLSEYMVYPLLLKCLVDGNEKVASASSDAIQRIATVCEGVDIIFPKVEDESRSLEKLAGKCSTLGRVRILDLIVKLFSLSTNVASEIRKSNWLSLLEREVINGTDTLATLNVLELLYELAQAPHGASILSRTNLIQLLSSIISNNSNDPILRSRAMMICGRFLSKSDSFLFINEPVVKAAVSAVAGRLGFLDDCDVHECIHALGSLGEIGISMQGATLLLVSSAPVVRRVFEAAFNRHWHDIQIAAMHAVANILGDARNEDEILLSGDAEEILRILIYEVASINTKLSPAGLLLSVLQQETEIRISGYRVISNLVVRQWYLKEVCANPEIINIVADTSIEKKKDGMEARFNCCKTILKAFTWSTELCRNPAYTGLVAKLQEAVKRGPYRSGKPPPAQPKVMTAERV